MGGRIGTGRNLKQFMDGKNFIHNLPAPVTLVSDSSWHENAALRVSKALKSMCIDATETIEGVVVSRLPALRGARWQIGRYKVHTRASDV